MPQLQVTIFFHYLIEILTVDHDGELFIVRYVLSSHAVTVAGVDLLSISCNH